MKAEMALISEREGDGKKNVEKQSKQKEEKIINEGSYYINIGFPICGANRVHENN